MNKRRMNKLIAALETDSAKKMFNMGYWIKRVMKKDKLSKPISQALKGDGDCGTGGCMLGMAAAVAPGFFKLIFAEHVSNREGKEYYDVTTRIGDHMGYDAFADWLEIPINHARLFCHPDDNWWYRKKKTNIKYAIKLLKTYRDKGIDAMPDTTAW